MSDRYYCPWIKEMCPLNPTNCGLIKFCQKRKLIEQKNERKR